MFARPHYFAARCLGLFTVIALIAAVEARAQAQELCVTCEEPFAIYRCAFDSQSAIRLTAPGAPLACAKQLAQRRGHARCSIRRNSSGPCEGELVIVTPSVDTPLAPPPGVTATGTPLGTHGVTNEAAPSAPEAAPGPAPAAAPGEPMTPAVQDDSAADDTSELEEPAGPPKTVEELAKRTAKSSKEGLKDAGEAVAGAAKKTGETIGEAGSAIGNAAKSTWRCLSTLFSDC